MATVTYSNFAFCTAGDQNSGHLSVDVSYNGGAARRMTYTVEEMIAPIGNITGEDRDRLARDIFRIHMAGRTRAQVRTEINAGPVTVTI